MISLVDITESFVADNIFLLKIKSNSRIYEQLPFCKTLAQEIDGDKTAYINILNNSATVFCFETADFEEIEQFLAFSCVENVFCNKVFSNNSQKFTFSSGVLLKCKDEIDGKKIYEKTFNPDYKSIYELISNEFLLPKYNEFVSDLSFRINHDCARVVQTNDGVVFTGWEDESNAIISAISVYITERVKGIGSKLLNSMIFDLKNDNKTNIFVYCEEKNTHFYKKNGFEETDKIFIGKAK